jgi:Transposase zinc-ribbon domain
MFALTGDVLLDKPICSCQDCWAMENNILQLADKLRTEADAYKFLEDLRWSNDPVCPHCEAHEPYFLTPKNGETRTTTRGTESPRRVWKCRKQFSVLTGTIFHGVHTTFAGTSLSGITAEGSLWVSSIQPVGTTQGQEVCVPITVPTAEFFGWTSRTRCSRTSCGSRSPANAGRVCGLREPRRKDRPVRSPS